MNRGSPNGRHARFGSLLLRSVALNFASAPAVKGAPPFGNNLGSNLSTSQTPEISGTAPDRATPWPRIAAGRAIIATTAAKMIKRLHIPGFLPPQPPRRLHSHCPFGIVGVG